MAPDVDLALTRLLDTGTAILAGELFDVKQGIRTGANPAFLLSNDDLALLPVNERKWFRPALVNESIRNGNVASNRFVFYPYDRGGLALKSEDELRAAVPVYFERILSAQSFDLKSRANIVRDQRTDWWGLSERRSSWALDPRPRIVSKYFGGPGGFAGDFDAAYLVVQGFAWFAKWGSIQNGGDEGQTGDDNLSDVLAAYLAVLNSSHFGRILSLYSPQVSGGQYDLSPRYIELVPLPNLVNPGPATGGFVARLTRLGYEPKVSDLYWQGEVDRLTAYLYGEELLSQV